MTARRTTATGGALLLVFAALLAVLTAGPAAAHGAPTSPNSRAAACGAEGTKSGSSACLAALEVSPALAVQWDNVRVADVGGRDREVIPDGELCSAGIGKFAGLDLPRDDWPTTALPPGADHTFSYRGTIPHEGTFRLYVTREGYAADQRLEWSDLETTPFLSVTDPELEDGSYTFDGALPDGLTGRHLIYTVWENSSTSDTYYSCSDVDFGDAATGGATGGSDEPTQAVTPEATPQAAPGATPEATPEAGPAEAGEADAGRAPGGASALTDPVDLQAAVRPSSGVPPLVLAGGAAALLVAGTVGATVLRRRRGATPGNHRAGR